MAVTPIIMPKLGLTMEEGKLVSWLKKEGEPVQKGEPIFEVETDKAVLESEAPASGVLRLRVLDAGQVAAVSQIVGYVADSMQEPIPGEAVAAPRETQAEAAGLAEAPAAPSAAPAPMAAEQVEAPPGEERLKASPAARRVARELGVDLARVRGTGPGGRIVVEDVEAAAAAQRAAPAPAPAAPPAPEVARPAAPPPPLAPPVAAAPGPVTRTPLSRMRQAVGAAMVRSQTTIPQFHITIDADLTNSLALLESMAPDVEREHNARLSPVDFVVRACAKALRDHPNVNVSYVDAASGGPAVDRYADVNIGLATAVPDGLLVPVIHNADRKSLGGLARARTDVVQKAKAGRLAASELTGSTFTISNLGPFGVDSFSAMVVPPEAAILGVGRVMKKPVVKGDMIAVRPMLSLSVSVDHRVLDGVMAAEFLRSVVQYLEDPTR